MDVEMDSVTGIPSVSNFIKKMPINPIIIVIIVLVILGYILFLEI